MKTIFCLIIIFIFWSCNDCNTRCSSGEFTYPLFTIVSNAENLFASKKIDLRSIEVFHLNSPSPESLKVNFNDTDIDTTFSISLKAIHQKIRIKWPSDSIDIDVKYDIKESDCCPDQTVLKEITHNGIGLMSSKGIVVISK